MELDSLGITGELPEIAGKYEGLLIIAAGGRCVWDDIEKTGQAKNSEVDVMCVNDIIMHYPGKVTHAYSNDGRWLPKWLAARRELHNARWESPLISHSLIQGGKYLWPWPGHGTSSLNAVYTGLGLGYDEIWLCGAPLDNSGHYFDPPWIGSNFENEVAPRDDGPRYWEHAAKNIFQGKVKSFSGRTKDLLGEP